MAVQGRVHRTSALNEEWSHIWSSVRILFILRFSAEEGKYQKAQTLVFHSCAKRSQKS